MIEARHAGHHHSADHSKTGLLFLVCILAVMVVYANLCLIYGLLRPKRPFNWPRPAALIAAVWIAFVLAAFIRHHNFHSVTWIARRAGRIGYAAAIFSQFLALKPAILPRTYVVGLTFCHKWAGRTAVLLAAIHGLLYTISYIHHGTFSKLFTVLQNLWGIVALGCYLSIAFLSLRFIRRRNYRLFYVPHVPLAFVATVLVIFHARPSAAILGEISLFLFVMAIIFRVCTTREGPINVACVSPSYDVVTIDRSLVAAEFAAGAHLRLGKKLINPVTWITPSHPYTIASLSTDTSVKLVVKRTRWQLQTAETYSLQGPLMCPYDPLHYTKVIAIGGGAGISFVAPVVRATHETPTQAKAVWITRSPKDLAVLPLIDINKCDVYITRGATAEFDIDNTDTPNPDAFELDDLEPQEEENGSDNTQLLSKHTESQPTGEEIHQYKGRPNLNDAFGEFVGDTPPSDVSVVACGPGSLIKDLKTWAKANGYNFFAEEYST